MSFSIINCLKNLIDFILPLRCLSCGKIIHEKDSLCSECFDNISFIIKPYCQRCGKPLIGHKDDILGLSCVACLNKKDPYRLCRSAIEYDEYSKRIILDFKFADRVENIPLLVRWLDFAGKDILDAGVDLIIPIPIHFLRLIKRKYNQSALLAMELSKLWSIPVAPNVLKKRKYTKPQSLCDSTKRKTNVKNTFKITNPLKIKGKRIVLIDDVYTTGTTAKECTKILLKAGAKSVDILTVARVCSH